MVPSSNPAPSNPSNLSNPRTLRPLERDTAVVCLLLAGLAFLAWPRTLAAGAGVLGGGALIGFAYWAIRGLVDGVVVARAEGRPAGRGLLVKFFTRHAILALAAYGMMARLRVDPVALLVGVTSFGVAAAAEAVRVVARGSRRY